MMPAPRSVADRFRDVFSELPTAENSLAIEYPVDHELPNRLKSDPRMAEVESTFRRYAKDEGQLSALYQCVYDAKARADAFPPSGEWENGWDESFASLTGAIVTLADYFRSWEAKSESAADSLEQFKQSLAWALQAIDFQDKQKRLAFTADMPVTQKRQNPANAFAILLCRDIERILGQPHFATVATITDVAYPTEGTTDPAAVRAAFNRDKKKRA